MGKISSLFLYFRIFAIFYKYMKNKIGILENDIYIFPIVISVNSLLVHSFDGLVHLDPNTAYARTGAYAASYKIFCTTCIVTNREAFTSTTTGSWASSTQHTVSWNEHNTATYFSICPYAHMHIYHHHNIQSQDKMYINS